MKMLNIQRMIRPKPVRCERAPEWRFFQGLLCCIVLLRSVEQFAFGAAPELIFRPLTDHQISLTWPARATGFVLEQKRALTPGAA